MNVSFLPSRRNFRSGISFQEDHRFPRFRGIQFVVGEGEIERKKKREKRRRMTTISIVGNLLVNGGLILLGNTRLFFREKTNQGERKGGKTEREKNNGEEFVGFLAF